MNLNRRLVLALARRPSRQAARPKRRRAVTAAGAPIARPSPRFALRRTTRARLGLPGMTICVVDRDGYAGFITTGYADIDRRTPVGPDHLFHIRLDQQGVHGADALFLASGWGVGAERAFAFGVAGYSCCERGSGDADTCSITRLVCRGTRQPYLTAACGSGFTLVNIGTTATPVTSCSRAPWRRRMGNCFTMRFRRACWPARHQPHHRGDPQWRPRSLRPRL